MDTHKPNKRFNSSVILSTIVGTFKCRVKNPAGVKEYTYDVIANGPPTFENTTINQTTIDVIETNSFSSDCSVNGLPVPNVSSNSQSSKNLFLWINYFTDSMDTQ